MNKWTATNMAERVTQAEIIETGCYFVLYVETIYNRKHMVASFMNLESAKRHYTTHYGNPRKRVRWEREEI